MGTWPSGWGSLKYCTVKYGYGSCATRTREWLHCKLQTRLLVREGVPLEEISNFPTWKKNLNLVVGSKGVPLTKTVGLTSSNWLLSFLLLFVATLGSITEKQHGETASVILWHNTWGTEVWISYFHCWLQSRLQMDGSDYRNMSLFVHVLWLVEKPVRPKSSTLVLKQYNKSKPAWICDGEGGENGAYFRTHIPEIVHKSKCSVYGSCYCPRDLQHATCFQSSC
jgi:hypothetical protein